MENKEIIKLEKILLDNLYSRTWCARNKIDYCNPNVNNAREIVYNEYKEIDESGDIVKNL